MFHASSTCLHMVGMYYKIRTRLFAPLVIGHWQCDASSMRNLVPLLPTGGGWTERWCRTPLARSCNYQGNVWPSHWSKAFAKEHAYECRAKNCSVHELVPSSWSTCIGPPLAHSFPVLSSDEHRVHSPCSPRMYVLVASIRSVSFPTRACVSWNGLPIPRSSGCLPIHDRFGTYFVAVTRGMDATIGVGHPFT